LQHFHFDLRRSDSHCQRYYSGSADYQHYLERRKPLQLRSVKDSAKGLRLEESVKDLDSAAHRDKALESEMDLVKGLVWG
jgi:hypothetical protein